MKKRILSAIMSLMLIMSITACDSNTSSEGDSTSPGSLLTSDTTTTTTQGDNSTTNLATTTTTTFKETTTTTTTTQTTVNKTMYATQEVNVRAKADTNSNRIGMLFKNISVKVLDKTGNWYKVNYKKQIGYVYSDYLTTTKPVDNLGFAKYQNRANEILSSMSIEEKVGQMFFVRCNAQNGVSNVKKYHLGGYILFAQDTQNKNPTTLMQAINSYQKASKIKMLIGCDEEGGTVTRLSTYSQYRSTPYLSPQQVFANGGMSGIIADAKDKSNFMLNLGLNINLAPVSDVSTNPNDYIYYRTFGKDTFSTANYVENVVNAMQGTGIIATLKHFPGYGNNANTHTGIAYDNRSLTSFLDNDLVPFSFGVNAGTGAVLVSHNIVNCMDSKLPASLSKNVHKVLRDDLGYKGVIMTDDLAMDAIGDFTDLNSAAIMAVNAGNDLIIASNYDVQIPAVINAVKNKQISINRINKSVIRILCLKLKYGIIK